VISQEEVVRVPFPTPFGMFEAHAFGGESGHVHLALVVGEVDGCEDVLTRLHSECLTGDALGSLRCDCGVQLRLALRTIAAEQRGVVVYATGHEGRGIGLLNKLRCYVEQDRGADTVDANLRLGLPVDARDYRDTATVLAALGIGSVRLLTNNPAKVDGLRRAGMNVTETVPLATSPHARNADYLHTKQLRLGHLRPAGTTIGNGNGNGNGNGTGTGTGHGEGEPVAAAYDTSELLGRVRPHPDRPYVVLKFAQTLDGRIATATGDAKWISTEAERSVAHALRASCDCVLVGIGTVMQDDPQLTVRLVAGASPRRAVLDSTARTPLTAQALGADAATIVLTTERASEHRRAALRAAGARVEVVASGDDGVDVAAALKRLSQSGIRSVLVEGGAKVITSMLSAGVVDRMIVAVSPLIIGTGTEAVRDLGVSRITDGIHLVNRSMHPVGDDVLLAWDVDHSRR
jgi:3,4-dihydroxy 2-butanone 4-phosphate synthase/GTP cyclohydrolase II